MLVRRMLDKLWNVYGFFVTYANIDAFDPSKFQLSVAQRSELDRWILSELQQTIQEVTNGLEQYDTSKPANAMQEFLENLSNWYLRRSRERFWKTGMDNDKIAAYLTLYECLTTLAHIACSNHAFHHRKDVPEPGAECKHEYTFKCTSL